MYTDYLNYKRKIKIVYLKLKYHRIILNVKSVPNHIKLDSQIF